MALNRLCLAGIFLILVLIVPVSAEIKFQKTDNGKFSFSNKLYWVTLDPIDDHTIGDNFSITGSTNFPAGTEVEYEYWASSYHCHVKYCDEVYYRIGSVIVAPNITKDANIISVPINSTGLNPDEYIFQFTVSSPASDVSGQLLSNLVAPTPSATTPLIYPNQDTTSTVRVPTTQSSPSFVLQFFTAIFAVILIAGICDKRK